MKAICLIVAFLAVVLCGCSAIDQYARDNQGDWGGRSEQSIRPDPIRPGAFIVRDGAGRVTGSIVPDPIRPGAYVVNKK